MTDLTAASFGAQTLYVALLLFADFADEEVRVALAPLPIAVPSGMTGDADADGFTFEVARSDVLEIGAASLEEGGSDALTISLSATPLDVETMNRIDDPSLYAGRAVKIWTVLHDGAGTVIEARRPVNHTMVGPTVTTSSKGMIAAMSCEGYAALLSAAPSRTWQMQRLIDPDDTSADAAAGALNGNAGVGVGFSARDMGLQIRGAIA